MASSTPNGVDQQTWNALLQWSMRNAVSEGGATGDGTQPSDFKAMSQENKDWLTKVMSEGVVDQVKLARELIDKIEAELLAPARTGKGGVADVNALLDTFEELQDITEQIDFAQNMVQIGGVPPLLEVITASGIPDELKCASLAVLATVAQNNPFAQNAFLNLRVLPVLVNLIIATTVADGGGSGPGLSGETQHRFSTALRLKALHGISCLSRGYPPTEAAFFHGAAAYLATAPSPTKEDAAAATAAEAARKIASSKIKRVEDVKSERVAAEAAASGNMPLLPLPPPIEGASSSLGAAADVTYSSSSSSSSSSSFPPLSSSTRVAAPPLSSAVQASTPPSSPAANHSTRPIAYALNVLDSPPCSPQQPQQDEPRQEKKINKMPKTQKTKSPPPFMDPLGRSPPPRERLSSASSASSDVEDIVACSPKGTQRSGRGAAEETEAGSRAQSSKAHRQVQPNNANGRRRSPFSTAADSLQGARRRQSSGEGSEGTVDSDVEEEQQHGQCEEDGEREAGGGGCSQRKPSSRKPMDRDSDGEGTRRERKGGDRRKRKGGSVTQEWGEGEGGFQSAVKKEKASSLRKEYNPSASFAASPPEGTSRYPDNNGESDGDGSK